MTGGAPRLELLVVRGGLCGGKAGLLPSPWGPYRLRMKPGSRGAVAAGGCVNAIVVEGVTQLMNPMLVARVEPVGQSWACGAGGEETEVGAGGEEGDVVGVTCLSMSLCGWYRSGM